MVIGNYRSLVWRTDNFAGTHTRVLNATNFNLVLDENVGGFDTAVVRMLPAVRVDEMISTFRVDFDFAISLTAGGNGGYGEYYAGPKIMVLPTPAWVQGGFWWENYVVETSSISPKAWDTKLTANGGKYIGTTTQDGSSYKHYVKPIDTWIQYWAIRQTYRNAGRVSVAPIFQLWRSKGLDNGYVIQVRLNLETAGDVSGTFAIRNYNIASRFDLPDGVEAKSGQPSNR
jgi:hypothetical protein